MMGRIEEKLGFDLEDDGYIPRDVPGWALLAAPVALAALAYGTVFALIGLGTMMGLC